MVKGLSHRLHVPSADASWVARSSFFNSFLSFALNRAYPAGVSARINMDIAAVCGECQGWLLFLLSSSLS